MENILKAKNKEEFRAWLAENSDEKSECWVKVKRGQPLNENTFYYIDAVYEALCFGWIDSTTSLIDGERYQRFSPRTKNSHWTELNKARARHLESIGLMTDSGRKILPDMKFSLDSDIEKALSDANALKTFSSFPTLYQRVKAGNIATYKNTDRTLYKSMLKKLIENTLQNKMFGEWNDYGRLNENT